MKIRSNLAVDEIYPSGKRLAVNVKVAMALGSNPASDVTVESKGGKIMQC